MKKALLQLHFAVFLAGFTGVFGKLIVINEVLLTWYRLILSALFLLLIAGWRKTEQISLKSMCSIAGVGLLLGIHWLLFYGSIKYATVSVGVVCFALTGFFTAFLEPLLNRNKISIREIGLSSLTVIGLVLIFSFDSKYRFGIILGVISSFFCALFNIYNERLSKRYQTPTITLYQMIGGALGIGLIVPVYQLWIPALDFIPSRQDVLYLLVLSLVCTVFMYYLITNASRKLTAFTVSLSFNLEPVYSIILAILLFNESKEMTVYFYMGVGLILISLLFQILDLLYFQKKSRV